MDGFKEQFLPLMIIRRYLKLTYSYCINNELIDKQIIDLTGMELPFRIYLLPTSFPQLTDLMLNIEGN
jgi:hypothetical protein